MKPLYTYMLIFVYTHKQHRTLYMDCHTQPTKASYVASHADVVEVRLCSLHFSRVTLGRVLLLKDGLLTKLGIVIEIDLCIKAYH